MSKLRAKYYQQQHCDLGEQLRWFKAFYCQCYNPTTQTLDPGCTLGHDLHGRVYIEQVVGAHCKALISQTRLPVTDPDFGTIGPGALRISVMPGELPLTRFDQVILTQRHLVMRPAVLRASGTLLDLLHNVPVVEVQSVKQGATNFIRGVDWQLNGASIQWLTGGAHPADNTSYSVEHTYQPTYRFLGLEDDTARPDEEGMLLPLRGVLLQVLPT